MICDPYRKAHKNVGHVRELLDISQDLLLEANLLKIDSDMAIDSSSLYKTLTKARIDLTKWRGKLAAMIKLNDRTDDEVEQEVF